MNAPVLNELLKKHSTEFASVVPFDKQKHKVNSFDFTASNQDLAKIDLTDTPAFSAYVSDVLQQNDALYGIGGYLEHRVLYSRSAHFDAQEEPRRLHLGVDIWGEAQTPVFSPLPGQVHSFAFNDNFGDYGHTIILEHKLEDFIFYTLYGHLSKESIQGLNQGLRIQKGQVFAYFGNAEDNGSWPPHLHFQVMTDMLGKQGDFPGVAKFSERAYWASICADANLMLPF
ncbi:MAG: peptidoglycan DD-metalloendopeptidase family protein [Flavobacterium sp.]|nr:peptidoglycan DD-metalloendopeptidase family protein [Flavobacterium sp.]